MIRYFWRLSNTSNRLSKGSNDAPSDRVTSWVEACNKYPDYKILRKGGDALDMLAKRFRPLVGRIIREFWGRSKEVLTEIGMLGLTEAIRGYSVGQVNYAFSTFAENKIRNTIHDTLRGTKDRDRYLYANPKATEDELTAKFGKEAAHTALNQRATETAKDRQNYDVIESGRINDDDGSTAMKYVAAGVIDAASAAIAVLHGDLPENEEVAEEAWRQLKGIKQPNAEGKKPEP